MDFCEGERSAQTPSSDELSPDFQMNIAQGMAHLHRQGTAHRDLKAMHVVLDANNRCKVISD